MFVVQQGAQWLFKYRTNKDAIFQMRYEFNVLDYYEGDVPPDWQTDAFQQRMFVFVHDARCGSCVIARRKIHDGASGRLKRNRIADGLQP